MRDCPRELITFFNQFMNFYQPHGHLPAAAGIDEHPASFVEAYQYISKLENKLGEWCAPGNKGKREPSHMKEQAYHGI